MKQSIIILAAIATIVGTVFWIFQYYSHEKNPLGVKIPSTIQEEKNELKLSLDKEIYSGERQGLRSMYDAANKMPYRDDKKDALLKVVRTAIKIKDFNMAIIAASDIPYRDDKKNALLEIVRASVEDKAYGYSLAAAEKIPYRDNQRDALKVIVDAFEAEVLKEKSSKPEPTKQRSGRQTENALSASKK